jgi:hypothetical protein
MLGAAFLFFSPSADACMGETYIIGADEKHNMVLTLPWKQDATLKLYRSAEMKGKPVLTLNKEGLFKGTKKLCEWSEPKGAAKKGYENRVLENCKTPLQTIYYPSEKKTSLKVMLPDFLSNMLEVKDVNIAVTEFEKKKLYIDLRPYQLEGSQSTDLQKGCK